MKLEKLINWIAIIVIPVLLFALTPLWNSMFEAKKKLEYRSDGKTRVNDPVFGVFAKDSPDVKVSFQGKELPDATFVRVSLLNAGRVPIKPEDFEGPLVFISTVPGKVLKHRLIHAEPTSLNPKLTVVSEGLQLAPLLLNPGDTIVVELFGSDDFDIKQVNARIAGMNAVSEYVREKYSGLSIEKVKALEYGRSYHSTVFRLPVFAIGIITFVALSMSIIGLRLNRIANRPYARAVASFLCFCLYAIGAFSALVFSVSLAPDDAPKWTKYLLLIVIIAVSTIFGIRARMFFELPRQGSTISDQTQPARTDET